MDFALVLVHFGRIDCVEDYLEDLLRHLLNLSIFTKLFNNVMNLL